MALCAFTAVVASSQPAAGQDDERPHCSVESEHTLEGRNCAFLRAGPRRTEFLPASGVFTLHRTTHSVGRSAVGTWRFERDDVARATREGGPLEGVFAIRYEAQPIGRFAHQVLNRGTAWRRVTPTRFVPPGAPRSSPVFVEWRREGERWVVSAVGDEGFDEGVPLPDWCC